MVERTVHVQPHRILQQYAMQELWVYFANIDYYSNEFLKPVSPIINILAEQLELKNPYRRETNLKV